MYLRRQITRLSQGDTSTGSNPGVGTLVTTQDARVFKWNSDPTVGGPYPGVTSLALVDCPDEVARCGLKTTDPSRDGRDGNGGDTTDPKAVPSEVYTYGSDRDLV